MKLELKRKWFTERTTSGILRVDGEWFCFSLEDVARADGVKIPGKTAIPAGEYKVILDYSTRFKRVLPHILDVPRFSGIRIHPGNCEFDTEGCVLLGMRRDLDNVWDSRTAVDELIARMTQAIDGRKESVTLIITNEQL